MIPSPPGFSAIINGITYGLRLAIRSAHPLDGANHPKGHAHDTTAIWQALWFRLLVTLFNGVMILGFTEVSTMMMFFFITVIDTLSYPVVSHAILNRTSLLGRYPVFITAFTWVGNLRVLLMMSITLFAGLVDDQTLQIMIFPIALWMIWAAWSVATQSLGRGGVVGAGMVFLALVLELIIGAMIITFIHPSLPTPS